MLRFARIFTLVLPLIVLITLMGMVAGVTRMKQEPSPVVALPPIDASVPEGLSTATFGLG
jgi:hypothetical protein